MPLFENRYQKTSFIYALMLSFLYLPLLLGILQTNKFINYDFLNIIVFVPFTISFITTINYKVMLCVKNRDIEFRNRFLFIPINFLFITLIYILLPFEIEKNTMLFSSFVLTVPWFYYFRKIYKVHKLTL